MLCDPERGTFILYRFRAQSFDEVAGIDTDRAGCGAESIRGAGVDAGIYEIIPQPFAQGGVLYGVSSWGAAGDGSWDRSQTGDFSLYDDPLARRKGQASRGTFRFAEAAFDTFVHFRRNGG